MRIVTLYGSIDIPNVQPRRPQPTEALGLAMDTVRMMPLNGMRYLAEDGGSGWYIWGGDELRQTADFFTAVKVRDLNDYVSNLEPFLDLPPGFRFQTNNRGHQKVWFDGSLLEV